MRKTGEQIVMLGATLIIVAFIVFLINQTAQLVMLAERFHPFAGDIVFWSLLLLYAVCVLVPLFLFIRLPAPLIPPSSQESSQFANHICQLAARLSKNSLLGRGVKASREDVEIALQLLDQKADECTKKRAAEVFISTAVSQNGSLDAVLVLAVQSKLVWEIAHVYYQRPTIRDLIYLYSNVAGTAFIAGELEDIDLSELIQPALTSLSDPAMDAAASAVGFAAGAVASTVIGPEAMAAAPVITKGVKAALKPVTWVSTLIANSVMTGSANAFLTLRVGMITKQYCRAIVLPSRRSVRRSAIVESARMLGAIVHDGARKVSSAILTATKSKVGSTVSELGSSIKEKITGSAIKSAGTAAVQASKGVLDVTKKAGSTVAQTTGHIAGQTWDITKSAAEKINPFKKKLDDREDKTSEDVDNITSETSAGDL